MTKIIYFHRNPRAGYSINKVTQTIVREIENKKEYYVPYSRANFIDLVRNIFFIVKHREKGAIHHITGDIHYGILGLIGYKSVLTIHDTVGLDFTKLGKLKAFFFSLLWYRIPLMLANKVICISNVTKKYLQKYTSRCDITVIHNAIDSSITFSESHPISDSVRILFIGVKENKNLIRCFNALKGINCLVTIIGKLTYEQIDVLEKNKIRYVNKVNLSDEEINNEYAACDFVSFCSLFEGFGMPALEANKAGRPVVCSSIPVLKEVAGNAAIYVDPYDVNSIRNGYLKIINEKKYREELVNNGLQNVLKFYPSVIKHEWESIYSSM